MPRDDIPPRQKRRHAQDHYLRRAHRMTISRPASRFTMKRVIAPIGVTATVLASLAIGLPAAQAAAGTDPVIGSWSWSAFTDPQADPSPPDDPDGQSGEGNLANVSQIGERYEKEAPGTE